MDSTRTKLKITAVIDAQNYVVAGAGVERLQPGATLHVRGDGDVERTLTVMMPCGSYVVAMIQGAGAALKIGDEVIP